MCNEDSVLGGLAAAERRPPTQHGAGTDVRDDGHAVMPGEELRGQRRAEHVHAGGQAGRAPVFAWRLKEALVPAVTNASVPSGQATSATKTFPQRWAEPQESPLSTM